MIGGDDRRHDALHGIIDRVIVKANEILVDVTVLNGPESISPDILNTFAAHQATDSLATQSIKGALISAIEKLCTPRTVGH